MFNQIGLPVQ